MAEQTYCLLHDPRRPFFCTPLPGRYSSAIGRALLARAAQKGRLAPELCSLRELNTLAESPHTSRPARSAGMEKSELCRQYGVLARC